MVFSAIRTTVIPALLGLIGMAVSALALAGPVITVGDMDGGDADCDYSYQDLALAIDEVQAMGPGEPATIRLAVPSGFDSLEQTIDDLARDLRLFGGFEDCASETAGWDFTEIRLPFEPDNRLFRIDQNGEAESRTITFERVTLNGQDNDNFVSTGGLVEAIGPVELVFHDANAINGRVSGIKGELIGGGAVFVGEGVELLALRSTSFNENQAAGVGGAIYCAAGGHVELGSVEIRDNMATTGGGIGLDQGCLGLQFSQMPSPSFPRHRISSNEAAGQGGAIYSDGVDITSSATQSLSFRHIQMSANSAALGGVIAMTGDPDLPATLDLANIALSNNTAEAVGGALFLTGGVRARIHQVSDPRFPCGGVPGVTCLSLRSNTANADSDAHGGGFAYLGEGANGLPELIVERGHLRSNQSAGAAAVAHVSEGARLVVHNSVISDPSSQEGEFLFTADNAEEVVLMYNTFAELGDVAGIHVLGATDVTVTGTIYWNDDRPLWTNPDGLASLEHGGCLLSSTLTDLPDASAVLISDPLLSSLKIPASNSPALNVCDERHRDRLPVGAMEMDIKFDARGTATGPTLFGPFDLGAVSVLDFVFQDRFE